jgi:hypothetical protein
MNDATSVPRPLLSMCPIKRDSGRFAGFRSVSRELPALARPLLPQKQSGRGTERPQYREFWRRPGLEPWHPPGRRVAHYLATTAPIPV